MINRQWKSRVQLVALASILVMTAACKKKVATAPPPPPPTPPPAPTASLTAAPTTIQQGQTVTLSWKTTDATDINIEGVGASLPSTGVKTVTPDSSTTYTLTAKGPGGSQDSTVRITVNPIPQPAQAEPTVSDEELFARNVKDVFFDYDDSKIRPQDATFVSQNASFLTQHSNIKILVEGHCDSRGSDEYNLALGESRADSVKTALAAQGVTADRVRTVSYGKERPFCTDENEQCWQQNRRGHFVLQK